MKATLYASPSFQLEIAPEELNTLLTCSGIHYDVTCRNASKVGGFLYGWSNCCPEDKWANTCVSCHEREIQLCLKILEMPPNGYALIARRLTTTFRACLNAAARELPQLSWDIPS